MFVCSNRRVKLYLALVNALVNSLPNFDCSGRKGDAAYVHGVHIHDGNIASPSRLFLPSSAAAARRVRCGMHRFSFHLYVFTYVSTHSQHRQ